MMRLNSLGRDYDLGERETSFFAGFFRPFIANRAGLASSFLMGGAIACTLAAVYS
jgi:hypothetical protein